MLNQWLKFDILFDNLLQLQGYWLWFIVVFVLFPYSLSSLTPWSCTTQCSLSVYLHSILKNHTAHACEGDTLTIECPSKTSVTVLSAFYGRRVPNQHLCPSANSNLTAEEDTECTSPVAIEVKMFFWNCFMFLDAILHLPQFTHDLTSKYNFPTVAESALRVSGPSLLSHPCLQSGVWTGPLSSHHQVPSCCLQV